MTIQEIIKKNILSPNWDELASIMRLDPEPEKLAYCRIVAKKILANKSRYEYVESKTGVPWDLIGAIHFMEASLRFDACLHNGQPWNRKTTIVPKGRGPWRSWEEAAVDAMGYDKLSGMPIGYWTLGKKLMHAERYNGIGYRKRGILSNYVVSQTNLSDEMGKYVADHVFDPKAPHTRPSVGAILLALKELMAPVNARSIQELVLDIAKLQLGVKELLNGSNKQIEVYHKFASVNNDKAMDDSVPWCAAFVCYCLESAGLQSTNSRAARSYLKYGIETKNPKVGDIVIFWRESRSSYKGHVGFFMGYDKNGNILVLGGNQSDMVCIKPYSKEQLLGFRTY